MNIIFPCYLATNQLDFPHYFFTRHPLLLLFPQTYIFHHYHPHQISSLNNKIFSNNKADTMNVEYLHVSQLYETITCFAIMVLFVTEGLALYNEMWGHISSFRQNAQAEENEWIRIESIQAAQREANDPEKSVGQALRQSAAQGDPNLPEGKQDNKSNIDQFLNELTPSQKSFLIFYLEYSSFISEHTSIILSVLVLGILTQSTMVFSLACFFCYLFCSLMFDFLHLEERLKEEYKRGVVLRRLVKILSSCFILAIFIDYWASTEFTQ